VCVSLSQAEKAANSREIAQLREAHKAMSMKAGFAF
jgi:hypothetical protein